MKKYLFNGLFSKRLAIFCLPLALSACGSDNNAQSDDSLSDKQTYSVARQWNEVLLDSIRNDYARPTVHARNLFHISAAMFDAWSALETNNNTDTYLLGKNLHGYDDCTYPQQNQLTDKLTQREQEIAISYAAYRLIDHRFYLSPGFDHIMDLANDLMSTLGLDPKMTSIDYQQNGSAALGNYIANCYIDYGLQDGANEATSYSNQYYQPVNPVIEPEHPGNPDVIDYNRWQAISLSEYIDQAGNLVTEQPPFLGPEWGNVQPFSLTDENATMHSRDGFDYKVYYDPGKPPLLGFDTDEDYKWNFSMVAIWSAHLDPTDGVMMDISPKSLGNMSLADFPRTWENYDQFYNYLAGGDASQGYDINPVTGEAYQEQLVPRGDYARVLAEFWADGPDSETPPGHWFVIMNHVFDHELFERKFMGQGEEIDKLEWDVKAYFAMGGTMHDAAISAWSIKGYYDYIRPVSAIRLMADFGQSSDPAKASYDPKGIPLVEGYIELVENGDELAGELGENIGKIKVKAWKGPDYIENPETDEAGVGWILAENWWPYQRPTFVTPPFAGYVSGHSTYSRAAAELLTKMTGSAYFPGGMSRFNVKENEFLVFEKGPSVDMTLEWATYRDASDQCSLSRIWGGIHPAADDIPGRIIGEKVGLNAFEKVKHYF